MSASNLTAWMARCCGEGRLSAQSRKPSQRRLEGGLALWLPRTSARRADRSERRAAAAPHPRRFKISERVRGGPRTAPCSCMHLKKLFPASVGTGPRGRWLCERLGCGASRGISSGKSREGTRVGLRAFSACGVTEISRLPVCT